MTKTAIIIPSRYGATRLPGKPLLPIAGQTLLRRVVRLAQEAVKDVDGAAVCVATDDDRIAAHCAEIGVAHVMTPAACKTGTDRVELAVRMLQDTPDIVVNLQGDAPLTPPDFIGAVIAALARGGCDVATPVARLTWEELDNLREIKKTTPFSGTTAVFDAHGRALWFSKNILPAIRGEEKLRAQGPLSPVYRHVGLYGYTRRALAAYVELPEGRYEKLEGLEQLRAIENGMTVRCVPVDYAGRASMSGVDSPEDIARAEALIARHGELVAA